MPGTSTLNSNNTIRLHRKRCASDDFSTNLDRATRTCNSGTPHNLSLAIGRFPEYACFAGTAQQALFRSWVHLPR